ncbi:MAG: TIGR03084 family protein [Eggerthellaceae bacterium]|nr:TIGR03084 family protein [Eggerthellaceae bacterium]
MTELFDPLGDLIAEQATVDALVQDFSEEDWNRMASFCTHWKLKDVIAHLGHFDYCAAELLQGRGANVTEVSQAFSASDEECRLAVWQGKSGKEILAWWRMQRTIMNAAFMEGGPKGRVPWAPGIPPMSNRSLVSARLMELWAHSVDIYDALGLEPVVKDRIASTLFLSWQGRPNMYAVNGLKFNPEIPMYLELTLPSGEIWTKGDASSPSYIKGTARDWALVSIRRRNWMDTDLEVVGEEARIYAGIVQTYAGPADAAPPAKNPR